MADQQPATKSAEVENCLCTMGIRPQTKAFSYLSFALAQIRAGTPFQNTIWDVTAIYFDTRKADVMTCVQSEITNAYQVNRKLFHSLGEADNCTFPPQIGRFLSICLCWLDCTEENT